MFSFIKRIKYPLDGYNKEVTNIVSAFILRRVKVDNAFVFQTVQMRDGTTPEELSLEVYNDVEHYLSVLIASEIINPFTDWPMDYTSLEQYTMAKYSEGVDGIHHFYDLDKERICDEWDHEIYKNMLKTDSENIPKTIRPVTNLEYEIEMNNSRKSIRVINPRFINQFTEDMKNVIRK